jgi:transposase
MEARHGAVGKVWIMDRGMASAQNLAWLRHSGRRYILGTPKCELRQWAPALADKTHWREIRAGIEVKLCAAPKGEAETFILCRSGDRAEKEKAMHERFSGRIEQALAKLQARIAKSRKRLNRDAINRQIGRLLERNQRAAARFGIELKHADNPAGCTLEVSIQDSFDQWAALSEGTYLLRSNVSDWSEEKLWKAYIQLTQAEAALRIQKDQLAIRPIWHQRADRVQAHILVCFLAFVLWKTLELWQARAGLGNSPRTLLEEFARIQAHDVILPTHTHGELRLRCVTQPDAAQAALLDRLGIVLPKRIRLPEINLTPVDRAAA